MRDAVDAAHSVRSGSVSARELVAAAGVAERRLAGLGALWARDEEREFATAAEVDKRVAGGLDAGALAGAVVAVKDCFDVAGLPTTSGVRLPTEQARTDAVVVARLRRAGAIPFGKAAMDQLGWTVGGQAPGFPPCLNPVDPALSPGGSSSGAAVAVAAGIVHAAIGTDVGGSVRIPAAWCGVVGFKPPLGSIPLAGVVPFAPRFDLPGVIARTVHDCEAVAAVLRGITVMAPDRGRPTVALLEDALAASAPEQAAACERAVRAIESDADIVIGALGPAPRGFGRVLAAELAGTWGPRVEAQPDRFTDDVRASVAYGRGMSADDQAEVLRQLGLWRVEIEQQLAGYDVVCLPTTPSAPPPPSAVFSDEATRLTRPFNVLGWPALSLPVGLDGQRRPLSLQLAARPSNEALLFVVARAIERSVTQAA